jgi:predicted nucleotidyltransferase
MQDELSRLFNRPVDLHTPASLSRYFRSQVLAEAEDQYVAL